MHLLNAAHTANALDGTGRDQVVATGDQFLQNDFRSAVEDLLRLMAQGVSKKHGRGEGEDQQRKDDEQAEMSSLAPRQRGQREINQVSLFLEPGAHSGAVTANRWGSARAPAGGPEMPSAGRPGRDDGCSELR